MNHNKLENSTNNEHEDKTARYLNGRNRTVNPSAKLAVNDISPDNQLLQSLQIMAENNAHLEELLKDGKQKMTESVASNAKFLRIVAHDLRNPISTIIGILDLLKESFDDWNQTEIKQFIDTASNSALNTSVLLDNLLKWSLSQNAEKNFSPAKIDLRNLVINQIEYFSTSASLKKIRLNLSVAPNLFVTADIEMVKTIFRNLISNAIKYTSTGGNIYITATTDKNFVKIEVIDNGIGMTQQKKEKLFKKDEFNSSPGTRNEQGTGLGLLFCKEFIGLHGGEINVESEPGKGSTFRFTLPVYI